MTLRMISFINAPLKALQYEKRLYVTYANGNTELYPVERFPSTSIQAAASVHSFKK